jgi:DNA-binding NarL/FixJ family response regulator
MGIRKFLLKPVDKDELAVAIRAALNSSPRFTWFPKRSASLAAS